MTEKSKWEKLKTSHTVMELKFTISRLKKSPLSIIGLTIVLFFVAIAILAPVLAPPPPDEPDIIWNGDPFTIPQYGWIHQEPDPPSHDHPFGTAEGNYDIYYGCVWGTITAFRIGFIVVIGALAIGLSMGVIAGYYGGVIDELLMRFTDIIFAFPGLILAMALVIAFGRSLDSVMLALVLVGWPGYTRVIRGEVLRTRQEIYVEASKAAGCSDLRVIIKHVLPNSIYPILIMASLDIGAIVLSAAALSFLGIGAPEGFADWGQMIALSRNYITDIVANPGRSWYVFTIPGLFIFTFVLGWNLLGDAFRDILDPTIRRK